MWRIAYLSVLLLTLLLAFPLQADEKKQPPGKVVELGAYVITAPAGEGWTPTIDKAAGTVQFQRVKPHPADPKKSTSSTLIQVVRLGADSEKWGLGEARAAEDYFNREEKSIRETLVAETKHELRAIKRGTTTVGKKKLYTMSYTATKEDVTIDATVYVYFPQDYRQSHVFYVFFFSDAYIKELYRPDVKEVYPVIESLMIVSTEFPREQLLKDLLTAVDNNSMERVKELLGRGAQPNGRNAEGWTPLMVAAAKGHLEIARVLIDRGAEVNEKNATGQTPLLFAAHWGYTDIVRLLIERGADVNARMNDGWTPLIDAVQMARPEIAEFLIEKGAEVKVRSSIGWSALMAAAFTNQVEIAKLLLSKGADINARDDMGKSALDVAKSKGHGEMITFLTAAGAKE